MRAAGHARGPRARARARRRRRAGAPDLATANEHYAALWQALVAGSGNVAYRLALNSLVQALDQTPELTLELSAGELRDHDGLHRLVDAVAEGDADAAGERRRGAARADAARRLRAAGGPAVIDLVLYAIPAFLLLLAVEFAAYRHLADDHDGPGYEARDTATSLSMGARQRRHQRRLEASWWSSSTRRSTSSRRCDLPDGAWWAWILLFFADDLAYYWFHRAHHEVRFFWASHVVHHSSQHYNLSTALRQTWTPMTSLPFWSPLALLGFEPWQILLAQTLEPALPVLDPHRAGRAAARAGSRRS